MIAQFKHAHPFHFGGTHQCRQRVARLAVAIVTTLSSLSGCREVVPVQPTGSLEVVQDLLSTTSGAAGTSFRARGSAIFEVRDSTGTFRRTTPSPWSIEATMGVDGVATLDASNTPAPPRAGEQVDLQSYVKFLAPVVAVAGSARQSTFYTGFSNTVVDSSGATLEVTAVPGTGGKPISAIVARRNGVPVSRLTLTWVPEAGGFLLAKQTAALYRGPSAELFAVMTVDIRYQSIDPQGLAARMARELLRYAVGLVLPQPLHAQSGCGARVLATVSGFVGLLASAPTVATGIGAIGWLAGWGMWTSGLMGMADACDKK